MMSRQDWGNLLDDVMTTVGMSGPAGAVHNAILDYHGKPTNKKLNILMTCGSCASGLYFAVARVASQHWSKSNPPPAVSCPKCGHAGEHDYSKLETG